MASSPMQFDLFYFLFFIYIKYFVIFKNLLKIKNSKLYIYLLFKCEKSMEKKNNKIIKT